MSDNEQAAAEQAAATAAAKETAPVKKAKPKDFAWKTDWGYDSSKDCKLKKNTFIVLYQQLIDYRLNHGDYNLSVIKGHENLNSDIHQIIKEEKERCPRRYH